MRRSAAAALIAVLGLFATACEATGEGILEDTDENVDELQEEVEAE